MSGVRRHPSAFSLVELLVVIAILVLVVALMLPAITKSIEAADRNQCAAKAAKLATAMGSYDSRQNALPGIRNSLAIKSPDGRGYLKLTPTGPFLAPGYFPMPNSNVSWFIMILPYVGFANQFDDCVNGQIWFGSTGTGSTSHSRISNDVTLCPSRADHYNLANGGVNMHYRANGAGASTAAGSFNRNDGAIGDNANNMPVSLADVVSGDGASKTLLIAEGKRDRWFPNTWSDTSPSNTAGKTISGNFTSTGGHNGAFVVHPDPGANLLFGFTPSGTVNATTKIINTQQVLWPTSAEQSFGNVSEAVHPGGSNVAFADGSWRFLSEELAPHVYAHLLTHRSVWDGSNYATNSARANVFLKCPPASMPYTLKPEDY